MDANATKKAELRRYWRNQYPKDSELRKSLSASLRKLLADSAQFKNAPIIALFAGRAHEPDIGELWSASPSRCVFPRVEGDTLQFFGIDDLRELALGFAKILEPPANPAKKVEFVSPNAIVLIPGTCFDKKGHRLGSGAGFYDRFTASLPQKPRLWGVCFDEQISSDTLPQEPTDVKIEAICTPSGLYNL